MGCAEYNGLRFDLLRPIINLPGRIKPKNVPIVRKIMFREYAYLIIIELFFNTIVFVSSESIHVCTSMYDVILKGKGQNLTSGQEGDVLT